MTNGMSVLQGDSYPPLFDLTIGELLMQACMETPDQEAVVSCHQGIRLTYKELDQQSDDLAMALIGLGLERGERIGIWSPNNVEWILTMYAAAKVGLVLVNVNPAYRPMELEYALNKVGCKALVLANEFKSSNFPDMVRQLAPELNDCARGKLNADKLPHLKTLVLLGDVKEEGFLSFDSLMAAGRKSNLNLAPYKEACRPDAPVNIQFTSGTTGSPKGATLTHHNIVNNGYFVGRGMALTEKDRLCAPVPLYHCFGMVMGVLACAGHRATLVLPDAAFDPVATLAAVDAENCTALYGVPTMFTAILDHPDFSNYSVSSLRTGVVGGSLCPVVLMERILTNLQMTEITNCYGMTETSPVSFQSEVDDDFDKRVATVGRVHPHVKVKIVDPDGQIVPRGVRGEICTSGYSVMRGYWADDEKTKESVVDGWMFTGDEGVIDEDGYCSIVGRIKDTIIRGGENIAPKEVEDFIVTHSDVMEVQAFGVPDDKYGEIICTWIKKSPDSSLSEQDIQDFCRNGIAHYKVPAVVRFVDDFPLTVTGKIQKFIMREVMVEELANL